MITGALNGIGDGVDPIITASTKAHAGATDFASIADHFTVIDHVRNRTCVIQLHRSEGYDVHRIEPGASCGAVSPDMARARVWQENAGGMVTLTDYRGDVLYKMVLGDGVAWEVIDPSRAQISLDAF